MVLECVLDPHVPEKRLRRLVHCGYLMTENVPLGTSAEDPLGGCS